MYRWSFSGLTIITIITAIILRFVSYTLTILGIHWQHRRRVKRDIKSHAREKSGRRGSWTSGRKKKTENRKEERKWSQISRESRIKAYANPRQGKSLARATLFRDSSSVPQVCFARWTTRGLFVCTEKLAPNAAPHTIRKDTRVTPGAKEAQPLSAGGCRAVSALGRGC